MPAGLCEEATCICRSIYLKSGITSWCPLQVFELDGVNLKLVSETEAPVRLKCGTFGASSLTERHLASGNFDGQLQIWDLDIPHRALTTSSAHKGLLNCIDGCGGQVSCSAR